MPKPLKVKIFMNASASALEEQLNTWLGGLGSAAIIRTETTVTAVGERPCIVVTVWYEPT
jgi:hypothetical protein